MVMMVVWKGRAGEYPPVTQLALALMSLNEGNQTCKGMRILSRPKHIFKGLSVKRSIS